MNNSALISDFINNLVAGNADAAKTAFSQLCANKTKTVLAESDTRFGDFKSLLNEEYKGVVSGPKPIDLQGDKVLVHGKEVGRIAEIQFKKDENGVVDIEGDTAGIKFVPMTGKPREFNTAEELFQFINQAYLGEDNVK